VKNEYRGELVVTKRPSNVGDMFWEADEVGLTLYRVKSRDGDLALLEPVLMLVYGERIPVLYQGLPLYGE